MGLFRFFSRPRRRFPQPDGTVLTLRTPDEELHLTPAQRWQRFNDRAKAAGCPCGQPWQVEEIVAADNRGTEPVKAYRCNDHAGMHSYRCRTDRHGNIITFTALYRHPRPCPAGEGRPAGGPIGQPPTRWVCPHKTHQE